MKILLLGGTLFLGRHLVETALASGHDVTLFNRGRTNPGLFQQVETLVGDRDGGLDALQDRRWDAVIDTCGYLPRVVSASAAMVSDTAGHYTFISSVSAFAAFSKIGIAEEDPVGTLEDETVEVVDGTTYGPLKALCEAAVEVHLPGRTLVVRPGLIVGPHDPSDRFSYWVSRISRGGEVLVPPDPDYNVQIIDVCDLSAWILAMVENKQTGIFNATGPAQPLRLGEIFETAQAVSGSDAEWVRAPVEFLQENEVQPFLELPLWVDEAGYEGFFRVNISKALVAGLSFRPLDETIADTLAWARGRPEDYKWKAGLDPEREAQLLRKLNSLSSKG